MAISSQSNLPELPPLKVVKVANKYAYLWPYTVKKFQGRVATNQGRKSVGKILGGGETGLVVWKDEFLETIPELRSYNVYREAVESGTHATTKEYKFVFKPKSGVARANSMQVQQFYQSGATWVLDHVIANTPFLVAFNRYFAVAERNIKLLSLAYYCLIHQTIDFSQYLHFTADNRLAYPNSMTEKDINSLLQDISDVDITRYFDTLQGLCARRQSKGEVFYAIDGAYPSNISMRLLSKECSLSTNNSYLDEAIKKQLALLEQSAISGTRGAGAGMTSHAKASVGSQGFSLSRLSRTALALQLKQFAQSQDDRTLLIMSAKSGIPHAFSTYNSSYTSLEDLCGYVKNHGLPQLPQDPNAKANEIGVFGMITGSDGTTLSDVAAFTNDSARTSTMASVSPYFAKSEEDFQQQFHHLSPDPQELQRQAQIALQSLGSISGLGSISSAMISSQDSSKSGNDSMGGEEESRVSSRRISTEPSAGVSASASVSASVDAEDINSDMRPWSGGANNNGQKAPALKTIRSSDLLKGIKASKSDPIKESEVVLLSSRTDRLFASLRHLYQAGDKFMLSLPLEHLVSQYLLRRCEIELTQLKNYNADHHVFVCSFKLTQHYPEYDVSSAADSALGQGIGSSSSSSRRGELFSGSTQTSLPRKLAADLFVHVVFDLKPLLALRDEALERKELLAQENERDAFEDDDEFLGFARANRLNTPQDQQFWQSDSVVRPCTNEAMQTLMEAKAQQDPEKILSTADFDAIDAIDVLLEEYVSTSKNQRLEHLKQQQQRSFRSTARAAAAYTTPHSASAFADVISDEKLKRPSISEPEFKPVSGADAVTSSGTGTKSWMSYSSSSDEDIDDSFLDVGNDDDDYDDYEEVEDVFSFLRNSDQQDNDIAVDSGHSSSNDKESLGSTDDLLSEEEDDAGDFFDVPDDDFDDDVFGAGAVDSDEASHQLGDGVGSGNSSSSAGTASYDDDFAPIGGHYDKSLVSFDNEDEAADSAFDFGSEALTTRELARLDRHLQQIFASDLARSSGAFKVFISNRLGEVEEVLKSHEFLRASESTFDLMSLDVFKVEQAQINAFALRMHPTLKQLMRGKNFVLYLTLGLKLMLQAAFNFRDLQYGGITLRERLHIKSVPQFLEMLQQVISERQENGYVYHEIDMELRSLLEYLNIPLPNYEPFTDNNNENEVRLARI